MTNLEAREGLQIYLARMKIDETFRDLKSLLGITKLRNKKQAIMGKMLAPLWLGEGGRAPLYGELIHEREVAPKKSACQARLSGKGEEEKMEALFRFVPLAQAEMVASGRGMTEPL